MIIYGILDIEKYELTKRAKPEFGMMEAMVIGIAAIELAKMIGITPDIFSLIGRNVL